MNARTAALALCLPLLLACSNSSSKGGFASSSAPSTSGTPAQTTTAATASNTTPGPVTPGPLAKKAEAFETIMDSWHLGLGQVQDVRQVGGQITRTGNAPSRCLWTGIYAASQAMRYRVTQDPQALIQLEASLQTLHDLHEITGKPGVIARGYDLPSIETNGYPASGRFAGFNYNKGHTSRDQYAGWFYGVAFGYDLIQDPVLKASIRDDVAAVADLLMAGNLKLETTWGPTNTPVVFFDLKPDGFYQDRINAQTWATVDDFPFNLITKSVPYSQPLADAIKNAKIPPIRAGEALRALLFFTVAEHVTQDVRYGDYKRQLLNQEGFAKVIEDYGTIIDDMLYGRNLPVIEAALKQLITAITDITQAYLVATGTNVIVTQVLLPLVAGGLAGWLSQTLTDALAWLHAPNSQAKLAKIMQQARVAVLILSLVGQRSTATKLDQLITQYGQNLNSQGLKDLARTVRSHLGVNLTFMPLAAMIRMEKDPQTVALYKRVMEKHWDYLKGDHNPVVNLFHAGYGQAAGPDDLAHSITALRNFPVDMSLVEIDNSNEPGLVVSPWPDRFGKVGLHALQPEYFPINKRAPDIFPWRGHPRRIKSGVNQPDTKVAPLGYLMPYWLARDMGALTAAD